MENVRQFAMERIDGLTLLEKCQNFFAYPFILVMISTTDGFYVWNQVGDIKAYEQDIYNSLDGNRKIRLSLSETDWTTNQLKMLYHVLQGVKTNEIRYYIGEHYKLEPIEKVLVSPVRETRNDIVYQDPMSIPPSKIELYYTNPFVLEYYMATLKNKELVDIVLQLWKRQGKWHLIEEWYQK